MRRSRISATNLLDSAINRLTSTVARGGPLKLGADASQSCRDRVTRWERSIRGWQIHDASRADSGEKVQRVLSGK